MNNFKSKVPTLLLVLMIFQLPLRVSAQSAAAGTERLSLSLAEAMEMALDQNFSLKQAEFDVDKTHARYRQTNAVFLPQLSVEYNAISTDDPLNVFGFKLKQEVVSQQDFNPDQLNDPDAYENFSAKFEVRQPLFNVDKILQRGAAKNKLNSVNEQYAGTRKYIQYRVQETYYKLVLHLEQVEVLQAALETASEHRRLAQNYYDQGMMSREDLLASNVYELDLESQVLQTQNNLEKVREEIALILGVEGTVHIQPTEDLAQIPAPDFSVDFSDFDINNAQIRAIDYQVKAAQNMVQSAGFSFLPSVNLFGSFELNDNEFANFGSSSYMIGANLRWDIFSGYQKAGKVMEAKADYRKAKSMQEQHLFEQENRVRDAVRSLKHATKELELTEKSITQSTQNVEIRTNRYQEGMEKTTDLLEAETKLAEAKLENVMALYKYNMSIAALEMLLEEDFTN